MEIGTFHCFLGNPCRLSFSGTCIYRHMKTKKIEVRFNIKNIFDRKCKLLFYCIPIDGKIKTYIVHF